MNEPNITDVKNYLLNLQDIICQAFTEEDGKSRFLEDRWEYQTGGGGRTRVLTNGDVYESAGVNFSHITGKTLPTVATAQRLQLEGYEYEVTGLSLVIHPNNPFVPTSHANLRFFLATKENAKPIWWFGGGFDLTPYYGFNEDCVHWHQTARNACLPFGDDIYEKYKKWCDNYFYLKHRQEQRGIGGLFFDDLNEWGFIKSFAFVQSVGDHYLRAYRPIVAKRKSTPYDEKQKEFQLYRRGRYVEFNLLYDRGTTFGLQTGGRTESILMSLPPQTNWKYNWHPEKGTAEYDLYENYLIEKNWLD